MVHAGVSVEEIVSLPVLLQPDIVERGLRHMLARNGGKSSSVIAEVASRLRHFGKITCQPATTQANLDRLAQRLAVPTQTGMTAKNRARLRVLQDDKNCHLLLTLPERLFATGAGTKANGYLDALAREDAVATAVLLVCPVRIKNLASINLDHTSSAQVTAVPLPY